MLYSESAEDASYQNCIYLCDMSGLMDGVQMSGPRKTPLGHDAVGCTWCVVRMYVAFSICFFGEVVTGATGQGSYFYLFFFSVARADSCE